VVDVGIGSDRHCGSFASDADFGQREFSGGLFPLFLASFVNPQSYWKLTSFDLMCGSLSLIALFVGGAVDSPRIAILWQPLAMVCLFQPSSKRGVS